jgi:hypothetical protein
MIAGPATWASASRLEPSRGPVHPQRGDNLIGLCLSDDLTHVDAHKRSRRLRHIAKCAEDSLGSQRVLLGVEEPERVLDDSSSLLRDQ